MHTGVLALPFRASLTLETWALLAQSEPSINSTPLTLEHTLELD